MPAPPLIMLCVAGIGLAALLYYYYSSQEEPQFEAAYEAPPRRRRQRRSGPSRGEPGECSICQENVFHQSSVRILACGHFFHMTCIEKWQEACPYPTTCPNCRQPVRT